MFLIVGFFQTPAQDLPEPVRADLQQRARPARPLGNGSLRGSDAAAPWTAGHAAPNGTLPGRVRHVLRTV